MHVDNDPVAGTAATRRLRIVLHGETPRLHDAPMNSAIHLPGDLGANAGVVLYTSPETLRNGIGRRTLRMTGLADRLREAAGT